jgi:hypothetical protein
MGVYNTFVVTLGPGGGREPVECRLKAYVGVMRYTDIRVGEPIVPPPPDPGTGTVGPSLEALDSGRPFWAYGIGTCGDDESSDVYARLHFRDGLFAGAELIDRPDNLYDWGFE